MISLQVRIWYATGARKFLAKFNGTFSLFGAVGESENMDTLANTNQNEEYKASDWNDAIYIL